MSQVVAIAGATGAVGTEFIKLLEQRNYPLQKLKLLASARSVGKQLRFREQTLTVEELRPEAFQDVDVAFFSAGGDRSKEFAPAAVEAGALVIDNSSAFRMDDGVPLVVPEINAEVARRHKGLIANPNCSTIQMVVALNPCIRSHRYSELSFPPIKPSLEPVPVVCRSYWTRSATTPKANL